MNLPPDLQDKRESGLEPPVPSSGGCFHIVLFFLVQGWVLCFAFLPQLVFWTASIVPEAITAFHHLLAAGLRVVFVIIPQLFLGILYPDFTYRRIYLAWGLAASAMLLFLPASLLDPIASQGQYLIHLLGLAVVSLVVLILYRSQRNPTADRGSEQLSYPQSLSVSGQPGSLMVALIILLTCAFFLLPWLAWGAQGSLLDSLLGLLLGISFGLASFTLLQKLVLPILAEKLSSRMWIPAYFILGFASSTTLLLLTSSATLPFGSMPLILMGIACLLGWLYAGLSVHMVRLQLSPDPATGSHPGSPSWQSGWPLAFLFSVAFSLPLVMFDPDELGLFLGVSSQEIMRFAFQSAIVGSLVLLLFAMFAIVSLARYSHNRLPSPSSRRSAFSRSVLIAVTLLALAGNALVYRYSGQPGFHGERLFVILKDQADLASIDPQAPPAQRRQAVYDLLTSHAATSQKELRQELDALGVDYTPYYLVNALELQADPWLRLWLSRRPEVDRVLASPRLRPLPVTLSPPSGATPQEPPSQPPFNITQVHADRVWRELGIDGSGILVGSADSGAQVDHPNLSGSYRGRDGKQDYNWLDPWFGETFPVDPNGHGTHTLGIALGKFTGLAPGAEWIACANLPRNLGNPALYLDCWQFLFAPFPQGSDPFSSGRPEMGAQVFNNSWGCPAMEGCDSQTFLSAVNSLRVAGVFVVVGAGNDGPGCSSLNDPPAQYRQVFSVGAVDESGSLAVFSSLGPLQEDLGPLQEDLGSWIKPDLVAPGVQILSSFPGSAYQTQSGTSMSGPHVTGVVALMWSANPSLVGDIETTERILRETAAPYSGPLPDCPGASAYPSTATGYGLLDAYAAVLLALDEGE